MGTGDQENQLSVEKLRQGGPVAVRGADCLSLRGAHLSCDRCVQACPLGALRRGSEGLSLGDACDGCGLCAIPCPTGAIAVQGFEAMEGGHGFMGRLLDCGRVPRKKSPAGSRQVPCLAGVGVERLLITYLESEVRTPVLLDRGWCLQCPTSGGRAEPWAGSLELAREILGEAGVPAALHPRAERHPLPARLGLDRGAAVERVAEGRRGFLRRLTGQPAERSALILALPPARRSPVAALGRHRLLGLASAVAKRFGGRVSPQLYPALAIGDDCSGQGACVAFCPTGALAARGRARTFDGAACVACGACVAACKAGAVRLRPVGDGIPYGGIVELALINEAGVECQGCGRPLREGEGGEDELCLSCARKHRLAREATAFLG